MTTTIRKISIAMLCLGLMSCENNKKETDTNMASEPQQVQQTPIRSIMTAEEQGSMSPDEIIGRLKKGNENFVSNNLTRRDHSAQRRMATIGQYPKAIVLSCVDSRVPVEDVFDLGIGDIFVARVAGNIENKDIVGSMEFATAVAGSKVVIVMGHTACGAVHHAIDNTDAASMGMNALADLLNEIKPSVEATEKNGDVSSKNLAFTNDVITNNAKRTVKDIRASSPRMAELESNGKLKIVAAVYDMETGKVKFLN
ncbi:carbonic anhydrase [Subsaximicrobium wynnwilliamsii]|uniref:Carbonic anhydrase n=1 Tax=Subsaximicrobium wynnwilliamsii TaxID=291179 RepID=A0A5C6ZH83_9FLAO|nr:carbonic anhydrase family protein [Subsaximicrobium wynnwilliamsii]TXD82981.1 carbonic anhydrase [Subsaximicrobium wynnwilliamsii]TXD88703.1 carbonic anhydrase [Subsaximicrobium wynnwilliamsii]TXE02796.1 carbonic anhydrase [Subsaximicrobium wynnwilliamsii]